MAFEKSKYHKGLRKSLCGVLVALAMTGALGAAQPAAALVPDYSRIIEKVYPAVVDIQLEGAQSVRQGYTQRTRSLGAGFVIDAEGVVVTNEHVVRNQTNLQVRFQNGSVHSATLVGSDRDTDLAVLRIDEKGHYPAVRFGNSDDAVMGRAVLAVGNPFGLGGTITSGIVSARNRVIGTSVYDDFIQTDASINFGNSGGPLFNMRGEVVGVNAAMFSPPNVRANVGIGFSIPATIAEVVVDQILEFGEARRGYLGVGIDEVTEQRAKAAGLRRPRGAFVTAVREDSPAALAGLQQGDIVLSFDRKQVRGFRDLPRLVGVAELGQDVPMRVWRDRRSRVVQVTITALPKQPAVSSALEERLGIASYREFGIELAKITPEIAERYNLAPDTEGAVVVGVDPAGELMNKVKPGDVVVSVDGYEVTAPSDASFAMRTAFDPEKVDVKILQGKQLSHETLVRNVEDKLRSLGQQE